MVAAAFSLAYLYSRSLWVPIVMHSLFNGVNVALLIIINP
jgi:membrane protease YdiL (CAAX protease family)